jgi:myo-inositol-1(or 4)-monophosphatase
MRAADAVDDPDAILSALRRAVADAVADTDFVPVAVERPDDPVTTVDRAMDDRLRDSLPRIVPCPYLSEESGQDVHVTDGPMWIVDPVDGTHNLVAGTADFAVSAALVDAATTTALVAVCALPASGVTFSAVLGGGAFRDGEPMAVGDTHRLLVGVGFPAAAYHHVDEAVLVVKRLMDAGYVPRQSGSAVVDICQVSAGRFLGFVEEGLKLWDFVAADLIATESGAVSRWAPGERPYRHDASFDYAVARSRSALAVLAGDRHG